MSDLNAKGELWRFLALTLSVLLCFVSTPTKALANDADAIDGKAFICQSESAGTFDSSEATSSEDSAQDACIIAAESSGSMSPDLLEEAADSDGALLDGSAASVEEERSSEAEHFSENLTEDIDESVESSLSSGIEQNLPTPSLGFVYVDEAAPAVGGSQNIVFALSDDGVTLDKATLKYFTLSGEKSVDACEYDGGAALFEIANLESGEYQLLAVEYSVVGSAEKITESLEEGSYSFEVQGSSGEEAIEVSTNSPWMPKASW